MSDSVRYEHTAQGVFTVNRSAWIPENTMQGDG